MTDAQLRARTAHEVLSESRRVVEPALCAALETLPASTRHIGGYHLGWHDPEGKTDTSASGGKAIRSALVLLTAQATRAGTVRAALPGAVAVELIHNSSLLHDDVIDNDSVRRHRPTAGNVFGIGHAILTGDAMQVLAYDVLAEADADTARSALRVLGDTVKTLLHGQCRDVELERGGEEDLAACEEMAHAKTGALMGCSCALGCLLAGGDARQIERYRRFGQHLGLAFQHTDDLLGIWGDPEVTGKPVHSDLRNRKKSLPVVYALTSGTSAGHELGALLQHGSLADRDLGRAAALVEHAGGRHWCETQAEDQLATALRHLRSAEPHETAEAELTALAQLMVRRDH